MKSIKEKSNEYAREFVEPFVLYYTKDEVRQFEAQHEDSFKAGANYVLEQIEKLTNNQNWCAFPKQSHKELKELIKQLKEK